MKVAFSSLSVRNEKKLITLSCCCDHFRQGVGLFTLYNVYIIRYHHKHHHQIGQPSLLDVGRDKLPDYKKKGGERDGRTAIISYFLLWFYHIFIFWHFLSLSFSISCFLFPFLDAMAYFCPCPWDSLSYFINCSQFLPVFHCFVSFC